MSVSPISKNSPEPDVRVERITPERAREYLGYNTHNRNLRNRVIMAYANDMRSGDWLWNGESIKFAADGALLDGQHRLAAIIEADVAVRTLVIRGLPNRTQETMDGGAKRKFSDVLKLRGEDHYTLLATSIRGIHMWESGVRNFNGSGSATNAQLLAVLDRHGWIRNGMSLVSRSGSNSGLPGKVGGLAWWLFTTIDPDDATYFFERLASDEGHHAGEPIYELRRAIKNSFSVRGERSATFLLAITVKAWNKYRAGETVGLLSYRPGGAKPEKFPEPR